MHNASLLGNSLKHLWSAYERQLEKRPVITQMTTSALLWGSGDLIAQRLEHWERQVQHRKQLQSSTSAGGKALKGPHPSSAEVSGSGSAGEPELVFDWRRAIMTGMFGSTFVGPVGHYWYIAIDKWCRQLVPGGGPAFIAAKVLLDTAAMGPFYVAAFFAWGCALIDGSGMPEFKRKMQVDFLPTLTAEITVWPIIQTLNFSVVPLKHQLLVVNTMTIFDACFMSWARNQEDWLGKIKGWVGGGGSGDSTEEQQQGSGKKRKPQLDVAPLKVKGGKAQ